MTSPSATWCWPSATVSNTTARDALIDELFIQPEYRGQGIGSRAMAVIEEACRELKVNALHLEVERHKTGAQQLYRKFGLVDQERYLMTKWIR